VAGGGDGLLRLATAHHARCLADPELNHPFSHGGHPEHLQRLAAYWGEVLGGPPLFSQTCGTESDVLVMHAGNGDMTDLGRRFVDCFVAAADDAGLPADADFRGALRAYMVWAVDWVNAHPGGAADVPAAASIPHWDWTGLVEPAR